MYREYFVTHKFAIHMFKGKQVKLLVLSELVNHFQKSILQSLVASF